MKTTTFRNSLYVMLALVLGIHVLYAQDNSEHDVKLNLDKAYVSFDNQELTVSTGKVVRVWSLKNTGLLTISFKNLQTQKEWCEQDPVHSCDWNLPTKINDASKAKLTGLKSLITDDEKFTSQHILVEAEFQYQCGLDVKYLIRVYPGAQGIWTALEIRSDGSFDPEGVPEDIATEKQYGSRQPVKIARSEYLPVDFHTKNQRRYWGFYNDPGNLVNTQDMVKERLVKGWPVFWDEQITWASGLVVEKENEGIMFVKESNKTVNNYGHQTGSFFCTKHGVEVTGWGLKPREINNEYQRTWANWIILFDGGDADMQLALKHFDRLRYPVKKELDMHILIDTWGSDWQNGNFDKIYGRENSEFSVIEKEIKSASDLGIDIVRIDDGWQDGGTMSKNSWHPNTKVGYDAHWKKTKALSEKHNVGIGLWAAIRFITLEEMMKNQEELGVRTWKFDFDRLEDHHSFSSRIHGIREFIKKTDYSTQTSWCPEYDDQRYGWYTAVRECGPMYFQNVQNNLPNHLAFKPYVSLRHHWMMSKYYNMNDLQCHWQNPSRTNPDLSDASLHSQSYCAMTAFMAAPSCFMLTQLLKEEERAELRQIIKTYKAQREELFDCYVFPIGDEPNNASWTGFQAHNPVSKNGFLMIFRELHNADESKNMRLNFILDEKIKLTNLKTDMTEIRKSDQGVLKFYLEDPADFHFYKYEVIEN